MAANKVHWWDAPKGYKAILNPAKSNETLCEECYFWWSKEPCPKIKEPGPKMQVSSCIWVFRKDKQDVIFVKRDNKK